MLYNTLPTVVKSPHYYKTDTLMCTNSQQHYISTTILEEEMKVQRSLLSAILRKIYVASKQVLCR